MIVWLNVFFKFTDMDLIPMKQKHATALKIFLSSFNVRGRSVKQIIAKTNADFDKRYFDLWRVLRFLNVMFFHTIGFFVLVYN